ncbi:MAG: yhfT 2 [Firmicutes bacterium]|nr:yhfT 2 [Bacillota bacterium]
MNIMDQITMYKYIYPNKIAIQSDSACLSYKKLNENVNKVSNGILKKIGNKRNAKIGIFLDNSIEFMEIFLASAQIGTLAVPMDPKWSITQIQYVMDNYQPDVIFTQENLLEKLKSYDENISIIVKYNSERSDDYNKWKTAFSLEMPKVTNDNDSLLIAFTSGTTGFPKGYIRSHSSWFESFYATNSELNINSNDNIMAPGPFVHSLSLYAVTHSLFIGATFLLVDKFEPKKVVKFLQHVNHIVLYMVPTMTKALLDYINENELTKYSYNVKSIISSGDKWSKKSKMDVKKIFLCINIYEFYGSSEASFISISDPIDNNINPKSVGHVFKNVTISIRNENGEEVANNEIGKIFVKSKMIFDGYYKNEMETKMVLHNGWLELGDYGKKDENGFIYIMGRVKNMIISGGLNIYPEEIEKVLRKLEIVEEVVVIGRSNIYWGEEVVALIKPKYNTELDSINLKQYCSKYLPTYKVPHEFKKVKSFPYTSSGKISTGEVKKLLEAGKYN